MKNNLYTIGEFAKICGVTTRTLKHYENIGLLKPYNILENGYRLYDITQLDDVSTILLLKDHDFSLIQIKEILHKKDFESQYQNLELQKKLIHQKIKTLQEREKMIDYTLHHLSLFNKYQSNPFIEEIDRNIEIEFFDFKPKTGTVSIVTNYLTDGLESGIIIQPSNKQIVGTYKTNVNGKTHLQGKFISCYSISSPSLYQNAYNLLKDFVDKNDYQMNLIYQECIIEWAQVNTYLVKYLMCIESND